ncbi:MAG: OmpA family protein [Prevotellaceae bacterium]|jgi:outer membrane protein OmpA-like peptidoglycan-associated protein|nr:OmpA family protein [Prevotellaceae bacterium]
MKIVNFITAGILCVCLTFSGCETIKNTNRTVKGGAIGTGAGAAVGAGVGKLAGNTAVGAIIGAVIGGASGALIGNKMDKQRKELEKIEGAKVETANNGEAIKVTFESGILFATNSHTLSAASKTSLLKFAESLRDHPDTNVEIFGHTDITGSDNVNIPLSQQRAASVQSFLVLQGVASNRLVSYGKGSSEPVASNDTPTGRAQNRRVEMYILANAQMVQDAHAGRLK